MASLNAPSSADIERLQQELRQMVPLLALQTRPLTCYIEEYRSRVIARHPRAKRPRDRSDGAGEPALIGCACRAALHRFDADPLLTLTESQRRKRSLS